mmetsp:Transcript_16297/g.33452  ORF Transcript_16297/g.33452 Transcript_16297/m.33452 type:complete len:341 (+) Transcript_16297:241-1263(+)
MLSLGIVDVPSSDAIGVDFGGIGEAKNVDHASAYADRVGDVVGVAVETCEAVVRAMVEVAWFSFVSLEQLAGCVAPTTLTTKDSFTLLVLPFPFILKYNFLIHDPNDVLTPQPLLPSLDRDRHTGSANRVGVRASISKFPLDIHRPRSIALGLQHEQILLSHFSSVKRNLLALAHGILALPETTVCVIDLQGISSNFLRDEFAPFPPLFVLELLHFESFPGRLVAHNFPGRFHFHRFRISIRLGLLRQNGGCQRSAQIGKCQDEAETDHTGNELLQVARSLLGGDLLSGEGVNFLVGEVASVGGVESAHGEFCLVEDAVAVEVVIFGDFGEAVVLVLLVG